ncbi:response regulator transcription factor [Tahibacter amnicola]|uniref:Response regulator transcription factor n=1 Tax=Tahibacter amnicola TaxID=2976241 RepID=A0ABY6BDB5_9GAMM|nr:response regulator transcription factor [Tahibacter amnicola]UXI66325.1 response regulator transcription factor [Tahibacter amnicola]
MQSKHRILVVEDEAAIRTGLVDVLVYRGFEVECAGDGARGLAMALSGQFDLLLLDVMLPGCSGFEICESVRRADPEQAIILLTARGGDEDIIQGLTLGADDYVTKPFSVTQLVLRIQAVLRRTRPVMAEVSQIVLDNDVCVDIANLCADVRGRQVRFTRREMDVMQYLHAHAERPVPREELLHRVWGYARQMDIETRTVDIHIAKLRRKLEADQRQPRYLVTVRGGGYRLLAKPS